MCVHVCVKRVCKCVCACVCVCVSVLTVGVEGTLGLVEHVVECLDPQGRVDVVAPLQVRRVVLPVPQKGVLHKQGEGVVPIISGEICLQVKGMKTLVLCQKRSLGFQEILWEDADTRTMQTLCTTKHTRAHTPCTRHHTTHARTHTMHTASQNTHADTMHAHDITQHTHHAHCTPHTTPQNTSRARTHHARTLTDLMQPHFLRTSPLRQADMQLS